MPSTPPRGRRKEGPSTSRHGDRRTDSTRPSPDGDDSVGLSPRSPRVTLLSGSEEPNRRSLSLGIVITILVVLLSSASFYYWRLPAHGHGDAVSSFLPSKTFVPGENENEEF